MDDTPEQIDTEIAKAYERVTALSLERLSISAQLYEFGRFMQMGIDELREACKLDAVGAVVDDGLRGSCAELFARYDEAQTAMDAARALYELAESRYRGWSRFFMVPGGHIHASLSCKTCNKVGQSTAFTWLPHLSGLTEAEAVAEYGPVLCTVCFPSAPLD